MTPAELDAMTAPEAWDAHCYAAWLTRNQERIHNERETQLEAWREQTRASVERFWAELTPAERADFEARASKPE